MLTPKLIPEDKMNQLEKAGPTKGFGRKGGTDASHRRTSTQSEAIRGGGSATKPTSMFPGRQGGGPKTERFDSDFYNRTKVINRPDRKPPTAQDRADTAAAAKKIGLEVAGMQKALAALEKAARAPHFTTSRERRARAGAKGTGFGAAAHTADTSWSQNMEKSSLYKAFGVQIQDRSQPSTLFLQKNINLQKNMDEYLDVYDEILQKAGMDWDNVTDEDFARLEKIDLGRFFGRGKKEEAPKKESGDRAAAAQRVQAGIRESQRRAGLSDVDRRREDVSSSMKEVKEGKAERLARGIGRLAGRAKQKVDQRENIGRKIGEAKDAGIAAGKEGIARGKEGIAEGRRRGGAIKDIATTAARSSKDVATGGRVKPKLSGISSGTGSGLIGANKTPQDHTEKFKPKTYDNPYRRMKQDQAKQAASRASNPTPQQGVDAAAAKRKAMAGGLAMSKAVVSLQKYLDDCGCDD